MSATKMSNSNSHVGGSGPEPEKTAKSTEEKAETKLLAKLDKQTLRENFLKDWVHFCKCIDFRYSNLDADANRFFNEFTIRLKALL